MTLAVCVVWCLVPVLLKQNYRRCACCNRALEKCKEKVRWLFKMCEVWYWFGISKPDEPSAPVQMKFGSMISRSSEANLSNVSLQILSLMCRQRDCTTLSLQHVPLSHCTWYVILIITWILESACPHTPRAYQILCLFRWTRVIQTCETTSKAGECIKWVLKRGANHNDVFYGFPYSLLITKARRERSLVKHQLSAVLGWHPFVETEERYCITLVGCPWCKNKNLFYDVRIGAWQRWRNNRPFRFCFPISDHEMPSWEFSFCFFISYEYICTCIRRHLKETIPSSSIAWSEMGKQNVQAEKVYCYSTLDSAALSSMSLVPIYAHA